MKTRIPFDVWAALWALVFLLGQIHNVFAQQTVITKPFVNPTTQNTSASILVTNGFQTAIASNTGRNSCALQNKGSNDMWVYLGPATSATKDASIQISSGKGINCITGSTVVRDEIAVTGTAGDKFLAVSQ